MTAKLRSATLAASGLILALAAGQAKADVFTLDPSSGHLSGPPGVAVSWLFQFTNSTTGFALLTSSSFLPSGTVGTYIDAVSANFLVVDPGATLPLSLLGDFQISPAATVPDFVSGVLTLNYDIYGDDPASPAFDPGSFQQSGSLTHAASISVTAAGAVPEPSTLPLVAGALALVAMSAWNRRNRRRRLSCQTAGLMTMAAAVFTLSMQTAQAQSTVYDILRHAEPGGSGKCHPDDDVTITSGCCGQPGAHGCVLSSLIGNICTAPTENILRIDSYAGGSVKCDLPKPACSSSITDALRGSGNTFYATSDIHYFRPTFALKDQITHVAQMNTFASAYKWSSFFGINPGSDADTIAAPRAVIVNGDLSLDASSGNLGAFRLLYEKGYTSESIKYPVFFGLGNHDLITQTQSASSGQRFFEYLTGRMCGVQMHRTLDSGQPGTGNYSWDFDDTHFVQLNLWAGSTARLYQPIPTPPGTLAPGLAWLKDDLKRNVGTSGRPVVINQHLTMANVGFGSSEVSWSEQEARAFWEVVRDYNLIGMFVGHTHIPKVTTQPVLVPKTDSLGNIKLLDEFTSGTGGESNKGDFIVARITKNYLDVGHVQWESTSGLPPYQPTAIKHFFNGDSSHNGTGCRKRINDQFVPVPSSVELSPLGTNMSASVTRPPAATAMPGPVAIGVYHAQTTLANRTFSDHCSGNDIASNFVLLSDSQLATLNSGENVDIPLTFLTTPNGAIVVSLYQLTPIKSAQPTAVRMASGVAGNPPAPTDPGLQTVILTGIPGGPLKATLSDGGASAPTWLTQFNAPKKYDPFGYATITFRVNVAAVQALAPTAQTAALQAALNVVSSTETDGYSVPISLAFKVGSGVTFSIDPPGGADPRFTRPIFTGKVTYPNLAQGESGAIRPVGQMTLYQGITANGVETFQPISYFYVNSSGDFECNLPPNDTVFFNYAVSNIGNRCPSYAGGGTSTSPFTFGELKGRFNFYAAYSGDANYAAGVSRVISYRVGADPATVIKTAGDNQSVLIGRPYPTALKVRVFDASGIALPNVDVLFSVASSSNVASATFPGGARTFQTITDSTGTATAPTLIANTLPGSFSVIANLVGLTPSATFTESIAPASSIPDLSASIVKRSGTLAAREWTVEVQNHGAAATQMQITGVIITQSGGPACTTAPVVSTIGFPLAVTPSNMAKSVVVNFGGCAATSRFTVSIGTLANGTIRFTSTLGNQFP